MQVRGPALLKLGFPPNTAGLNEYMAVRQPGDDLSELSDADFKLLIDAHNRIVALMSNGNPSKTPDALALRKQGQSVDMGSAFEAEAEVEEEEAQAAPSEEVAALVAAPAAAPVAVDVT